MYNFKILYGMEYKLSVSREFVCFAKSIKIRFCEIVLSDITSDFFLLLTIQNKPIYYILRLR